jgi:hypothetical protein
MSEQRYWFLARGNDEARAELALSIPWWPEAVKWIHEEGDEHVAAPMLFTTREAADEELSAIEDTEAGSFLDLVEQHGETTVNEAYDNTPPWRSFDIDPGILLDKLEDSDFLCVVVDHQLKLRQDFVAELSTYAEE